MTVTEALIEKLKTMPEDRRQELLDFAEFLEEKEKPREPRPNLYGALSHLDNDIALEDFREARREMWNNFPREHFYDEAEKR